MIRHFVTTGYVVHNGATLLHWHKIVRMWLPPGGHIDPNEDPVQGVIREIEEETGLKVCIMRLHKRLKFLQPDQIEPPVTILVEDVSDSTNGAHQHIDMIYFTKLVNDSFVNVPHGWHWLTREDLLNRKLLESPDGHVSPPEDVIQLGLKAIEALDQGPQ